MITSIKDIKQNYVNNVNDVEGESNMLSQVQLSSLHQYILGVWVTNPKSVITACMPTKIVGRWDGLVITLRESRKGESRKVYLAAQDWTSKIKAALWIKRNIAFNDNEVKAVPTKVVLAREDSLAFPLLSRPVYSKADLLCMAQRRAREEEQAKKAKIRSESDKAYKASRYNGLTLNVLGETKNA